VEADCVYCILASIEFVCGKGYVTEKLHITTDYPVMPLPCAPELVGQLAASHAREAATALRSGRPFGLTLPSCTDATDIFVPTGKEVHGAPVYRGVQRAELMYRCTDGLLESDGSETWAITADGDGPASEQCGGRVEVDIDARRGSQARMGVVNARACPAAMGGFRFDSGFDLCTHRLLGDDPGDRSKVLSSLAFAESSLQIACAFVRSFGAHTVRPADESVPTTNVTIRLTRTIGTVQLLDDLVVREGESLRLEADDDTLATIVVGARQLRVEAGGMLELVRVKLTNSTGSTAIGVRGRVVAVDSTFSDCVTEVSAVLRYLEAAVPTRAGVFPTRGAHLLAAGSVALVYLSRGALSLRRCVLEGNVARGPATSALGGAVLSLGAHVIVEEGSAFRQNSVVGLLSLGGFGGAIASVMSGLSVLDATFAANSVDCLGGQCRYSQGGAMFLLRPREAVVVRATLLASNGVSGGAYSEGGAIELSEEANLTLRDSLLRGNFAQDGRWVAGGAVGLNVASAVLIAVNTTFENNTARRGTFYTRGGALHAYKGRLELGRAVAFHTNAAIAGVDGEGAVEGGAVALAETASLSAVEAPVFEDNEVTGTDPKGGALFVDASTATVIGGRFEANRVTAFGGHAYGGTSEADIP
jgi:hypothetical protein